ncbi:AAA family ATPase [Aeromonas caviae]|uniref:Chromosome segregation protein SMC n=1 Tax=Aeromonas caviae TaxID=648 RepID=A0AAV4YJR4_AERCA|nr:AAA family ATPase [Aeromonas caviae]BCM76834.1 chromosome segregation protein SMC [Aeromonas caviae]GJA32433.1 chromosome segregation protein SMC [Aeromonas caviae]GJA36283.1 chromosome segregation protein SMC [Aeromonas caviae]GJA41422.1 chromosome segregation protein SMC [Aeromonas caviae]GJA49650.1 chromosome segregation protein SMC [Aeromonas caviae]
MKDVTSSDQLSRIVIDGYKSIAHCDLKMGSLNVLIGANGAGKSNFIGFFRLIATLLDHRLQSLVGKAGGPDALLHFGRKQSETLKGALFFGNNGYQFALEATNDNRMMFQREALWWNINGINLVGSGHFESRAEQHHSRIKEFTLPIMRRWRGYHFHDTSESAKVKQIHRINDNDYLREDGANLAAFLFRIQKNHPSHYKRIIRTIRMVAPYFGDFYLRATPDNQDSIQLEWTEKDHDIPFKASELSDGTLRFILLATVLLQPEEFMPSAIIVDEPELGLHPYAINVLAELIKSASHVHQLIISTQSVELVNQFDAEDLIVVDKQGGSSTFKRLETASLSEWLEDYSLGDLWKKNLLGGRPQS